MINKYKNIQLNDLFFCYSKRLSSYIYNESGIVPLTIAISPSSGKEFRLYSKSEKLQETLDKYMRRTQVSNRAKI